MPQSDGPDHDQRLKVLLKEFFAGVLPVLLPRMGGAVRVRRDRLAGQGAVPGTAAGGEAAARPGGPAAATARCPASPRGVDDLVALVHVEVESRASTVAFRPRMFEYYIQLRRDTGLPVLPIALFLRLGLDGHRLGRV